MVFCLLDPFIPTQIQFLATALGRTLQFSDRHLQILFSTKDIMGAQDFNFAPKFPQREIFSSKFCIFGLKIFRQNLSRQTKIYGVEQLPPCPLPRRQWWKQAAQGGMAPCRGALPRWAQLCATTVHNSRPRQRITLR